MANIIHELYKTVYIIGRSPHYVLTTKRHENWIFTQRANSLELLAQLLVENSKSRIESLDSITTLNATMYNPSDESLKEPICEKEILQFYKFYVHAVQRRKDRLSAV